MRRSYLDWITDDPHRARVVFLTIVGATALGASIAAIHLALGGSGLRWLIGAAGFAAGALVMLGLRRAGQWRAASSRAGASRFGFVSYALIGASGVFLDHARATIEIGALATGAGVLATLGVLAWRSPGPRP